MANAYPEVATVRIVDADGVIIESFGGAGGVSQEDGSAYTPDTSNFVPIGGYREDTPSTLAEGEAGAVRVTTNRELLVSAAALPLPTGAATAANQLPDGHNVTVDNASLAVTAASLPLPTGASTAANQSTANGHLSNAVTALQLIDDIVKLEDAGHSSGDAGIMLLGVRNDSLGSTFAGANGDYGPVATDIRGQVFTGDNKVEDAAHNSGEVGSFVLAVRRDTASVSGASDGDYSSLNVDGSGRLWSHDPVSAALLTTIDADTGGMLTALQIMDDWDESDRAKVNIIVGQAGVAGGAGAVGATVQRVTLASDDPAVVDLAAIEALLTTISGRLGATGYFSSTDLDETEEQVSGSAVTVVGWYWWNLTDAPLWAQVWNATAANVTPGSTAPAINFPIPANADSDGAGVVMPVPSGGVAFSTALSVAVTGARGSDATSIGTAAAGCVIFYR